MRVPLLCLSVVLLAGCAGGGGAETTPLVNGRALRGSGGCGTPDPDGGCSNPVVYVGFRDARLRVYPEFGETLIASTTADTEGQFTLRLPTGTYRVNTEQLPENNVLLTVTNPPSNVTLSFYNPPP